MVYEDFFIFFFLFFFVCLFCCFVFFFPFFCKCQSPVVCSGNSIEAGCCAAKHFQSKERRNLFLADNLSRHQGKKVSKGSFFELKNFDWKCKFWKCKANLEESWKLDDLPVKYGLFLFAC